MLETYAAAARRNLNRHTATTQGACWRCSVAYQQAVAWPCFPWRLASYILRAQRARP